MDGKDITSYRSNCASSQPAKSDCIWICINKNKYIRSASVNMVLKLSSLFSCFGRSFQAAKQVDEKKN
jgi:hypothetical protein